jgi:hypothetical protein
LPPDDRGKRYSNSDPVTGQAAWFDLRVRISKCLSAECGYSEPRFGKLPLPPGISAPPDMLSYGAEWRQKVPAE